MTNALVFLLQSVGSRAIIRDARVRRVSGMTRGRTERFHSEALPYSHAPIHERAYYSTRTYSNNATRTVVRSYTVRTYTMELLDPSVARVLRMYDAMMFGSLDEATLLNEPEVITSYC